MYERNLTGSITFPRAEVFGDLQVLTYLLSEPCLLGFWGDLVMFLNDDSHIERNRVRAHSDADRLTLRKPSKPGSSMCP